MVKSIVPYSDRILESAGVSVSEPDERKHRKQDQRENRLVSQNLIDQRTNQPRMPRQLAGDNHVAAVAQEQHEQENHAEREFDSTVPVDAQSLAPATG